MGPKRHHQTRIQFRYHRLPSWETGASQQGQKFEVVVESWMLPVESGLTALHDQEEGSHRRHFERARDLFCVVVRLSFGLQAK